LTFRAQQHSTTRTGDWCVLWLLVCAMAAVVAAGWTARPRIRVHPLAASPPPLQAQQPLGRGDAPAARHHCAHRAWTAERPVDARDAAAAAGRGGRVARGSRRGARERGPAAGVCDRGCDEQQC
jgi:hypothetical protein